MRTTWTTRITWVIAGILVAGSLAAMDINKLPPDNWRAPTGVHTMTDATSPRAFIGLPPCRIVDTRGTAGIPINTGGAFAANEARTWTFTGLCGIPAGADAVSLNITVTDTGGQTAFGFVKVWPGGGTEPNVSTLNWSTGGVTESNAAIVPFGTGGSAGAISLRSGNNSSDVIVDTNGYFSSVLGTPGNVFVLSNNSTAETMFLHNASASCILFCGLLTTVNHGVAIWGESTTAGDGVYGQSDDASGAGVHGVVTPNIGLSAAVRGEHGSTGSGGIGVYGSHAGSGWGVYGEATGTTGSGSIGVYGVTFSATNGAKGVQGISGAGSGRTYGVLGISDSVTPDSAGVRGVDVTGTASTLPIYSGVTVGVIGDSRTDFGVGGRSRYVGVNGQLFDTNGAFIAEGLLATTFGTAPGPFFGPWGVFAGGNFGASGAKHFVEPHPADPNTVIVYSSLEGREVGTYFRGTARVSGGQATIQIPEDFRIVTDDNGLTVQLTSVGAFAQMYVASQDLNQIVVHSSRDVQFHYLVQGVRRAFKDFQPVGNGREFMPRSADARMPGYLTEEAKRRLIANGTYNADGTVNTTTAERAGWTKVWADRQAEREAAIRETREAREAESQASPQPISKTQSRQ